MAEALEDEAAGLGRRAATFDEQEFLISREIEARQTEINRLQLRLEALHAERATLFAKIEKLKMEAAAMREEIYNSEDEIAIAAIAGATPAEEEKLGAGAAFFHRLNLP